MKKLIIILSVLILLLSGCQPKPTAIEKEPQKPIAEVTQSMTEKPKATPEPTATFEPQPTPDADPMSKMEMSQEEIGVLLSLWPIDDKIEEHGDIISFTMNSQVGIDRSTVNYTFSSNKSKDDLMAKYQELVKGEWEDSEYSAGPSVFGGIIHDTLKTTCQISTIDSNNEVFLSMFIDGGSNELDEVFKDHLPIGLFDMHELLNEESLYFKELEYIPNEIVVFTQNWKVDNAQEIFTFYKDILADCDYYMYIQGDEYTSESIQCSIEGINLDINYSTEMGTFNIGLSRNND